jgi:putative peptidoglycan lipid II flippase
VPVTLIWALGNLLSLVALHSHPEYIVIGVGISMTVSNAVGAALSFYLLSRRFGDLDGQRLLDTHLRMAAAAGIAGVVAFVISHLIHAVFGLGHLSSLLAAGLAGPALIAVYVVALRRLKVTELDDTLLPLIRRR